MNSIQKKRSSIPPIGVLGESSHPPAKSVMGIKESPLIEFILRRHPQETVVDRLKKEYIRTSQDMTVERLKIFLGKKLGHSPYSDFQVCYYIPFFFLSSSNASLEMNV